MKYKIFIQLGNSKKPRWLCGDLVESYSNETSLVEIHGQKIITDSKNVKKFQKAHYDKNAQEYPELSEFVNNNWDTLKNIIEESVGKFFPDEKVSIDDKEKTISAFDNNLVVCGGIFELETMSAFIEVPEWSVTEYRTIPSTRWEPEDFSEKCLGHTPNNINAAKIFVDAIWNSRCEGYWENKFFEIAY